jgi:hypothetical protein
VAGNNNYPDNNRDPYGVDDDLDTVHNDPFQKSGLPITARCDLVKRIIINRENPSRNIRD